jgi:hypothetical protein
MRTIGRGNVVARYDNLWHMPNKRRKHHNIVTFFLYFDTIMYLIEHTLGITTEKVETYKDIA